MFTVRSKKNDYVISKSLVCFVAGAFMIVSYFIGAMIGGKVAGLPFDTIATSSEIFMYVISKILLVSVFAPIFLVMSVVGKQKLWLSLILSFGVGMLLFTMAPMITPLDSSFINVILCLAGGLLFGIGIGTISNLVLVKKSIL